MTPEEIELKKLRLEKWKVFLSVLTPLFVLAAGLIVNMGLESQKQILQEAQLKEQKIDLIQKIVPEIIDKGETRNGVMMRLLENLDTTIARQIKNAIIKNITASTLNNDSAKTDNILQAAKSIGGQWTDTVKSIAAHDFEKKAVESLVKKDINGAITNFSKADIAYPSFHNASELSNLLSTNKTALKDTSSKNWATIYSKILKDYTWGLPKQYQTLILYKSGKK